MLVFYCSSLRLLVSLFAGRQDAGEKPVVVLGERPLLPWCDEDRDHCVIHQGTTKACRPFSGSKTAHRIRSLFDPAVILLQPMMEIRPCSMLDMATHCCAYGPRRGRMAISRGLVGHRANHSNSLLEEAPVCFPMPLLAQHGVNEMIISDRLEMLEIDKREMRANPSIQQNDL